MPVVPAAAECDNSSLRFTNSSRLCNSEYENLKIGVKQFFGVILFDFSSIDMADVDQFLVSVALSAAGVILWWLLFGGLLLNLVMNVNGRNIATQTRYQLYQKLDRGFGSYYLFTLLSDTFMIAILSNLMRTMDCTYNNDQAMPNQTGRVGAERASQILL